MSSAGELRVVRARDRAAVLGVARVGLGLAVAAAAANAVSRQQLALGLALGVLGFAVVGTARQLELNRVELEEGLPQGAVVVGPWRAAAAGLYPSSLGVLVLGLVAVPVEPLVAPLLAGLLVGMGLVTLASLALIASDERLHRRRVFGTAGGPPHAYAVADADGEPVR
jgi:hypothetical protein